LTLGRFDLELRKAASKVHDHAEEVFFSGGKVKWLLGSTIKETRNQNMQSPLANGTRCD